MEKNILVTVDTHYVHPLTVMLKSLAVNNPGACVVYVMSRDLTGEDIEKIKEDLDEPDLTFVLCPVTESPVEKAPTSRRYPMAIYDRLFAAEYLPDTVDRVLYLDPDLVVLRPLDALFSFSFGDNLYAAASHVGKVGDIFNSVRVEAEEIVPYYNSGVLVMNLAALRREQDPAEIERYILEHYEALLLPDQDVLTGLYGTRILPLDPYRFNMTERLLTKAELQPGSGIDAGWVFENSVIVHYIGRNKPWNPHYRGKLDVLYKRYEKMLGERAD